MASCYMTSDARVMALRLSAAIDAVTDRLEAAEDADAFLGALHGNAATWADVHVAAALFGWEVPQRLLDFSRSAVAWAKSGIDDHEVDVLIAVNRVAARHIAELGRPERPGCAHGALWPNWLSQRLPIKARPGPLAPPRGEVA